jgi:uncharacterized protein YukE
MRQKAGRIRVEARRFDESAQTLRSVARSIRGLLSGVAGFSRSVWQGPAAAAFEREAEMQSRYVDEQADVLGCEAAAFESKANRLRSEANRLIHDAAQLEAQRALSAVSGPPPDVL